MNLDGQPPGKRTSLPPPGNGLGPADHAGNHLGAVARALGQSPEPQDRPAAPETIWGSRPGNRIGRTAGSTTRKGRARN